MEISDGLTVVTLVVASVSMVLSSIALWPRSREALSFVRDVILWVVFVFVFVGAGTLGWRHYRVTNGGSQSAAQPGRIPAGPTVIEANYVPPAHLSPTADYWDRDAP